MLVDYSKSKKVLAVTVFKKKLAYTGTAVIYNRKMFIE